MSGVEAEDAVLLAPEPASVGAARREVRTRLHGAGLGQLVDDAALAASELVANAVLHARTQITLRVATTRTAVRVTVEDLNPQLPTPAPMGATATSGRGLALLQALAEDWGVHPLPCGKAVWFSLSTSARVEPVDLSPEALLDLWAGAVPRPGPASPAAVRITLPDLPVQCVVSAKRRVEDLVRDLRLVLLGGDLARAGADEAELAVARRLDAAVEAFDAGRVQLRSQALAAAAAGLERATLVVLLPPEALPAAEQYRTALDEADALGQDGRLLLAGGLGEHADLRRSYLDAIIARLRSAQPQRR